MFIIIILYYQSLSALHAIWTVFVSVDLFEKHGTIRNIEFDIIQEFKRLPNLMQIFYFCMHRILPAFFVVNILRDILRNSVYPLCGTLVELFLAVNKERQNQHHTALSKWDITLLQPDQPKISWFWRYTFKYCHTVLLCSQHNSFCYLKVLTTWW